MGELPRGDIQSREVFVELCRRLRENVERGLPDQSDDVLRLPASTYSDPEQFRREIELIFGRIPLLVALNCDIPDPGDFLTMNIIGRPLLIVRGDDGQARVFLNTCRHRGAAVSDREFGNSRMFVCPYHSWSYDRQGKLCGIPDNLSFGDPGVAGLTQLPSDEVAGAIFASLDPKGAFSATDWLGPDMVRSFEALRLNEMYPYRKLTRLDSPNWKLAADGYLDGYHIGLLHRDTIGTRAINNRNTYDLFGPHARIGFANKGIRQVDELPEHEWVLGDCMSLVHYVFPNVSLSGGHKDTIQLSRLFPGSSVNESTTVQHQYFYQPMEGDMLDVAESKRLVYEEVVRDEDCRTIFTIGESLHAMQSMDLVFGRNEPANQAFHLNVERMTRAD